MDTGPEDISDAQMKAALRKQALWVQLKSLATAVVPTAITFLL